MSLHEIAKHIQAHGRGDDTMLMHVTPREVKALQGLARAGGGSLTTNPHTGLPEAGFLDNLLPTILPLAAGAALAATGVGAPLAAGMVGAGMYAATGDLNKGLMAGLGAFGGAGLAGGLMEAGAGALAESAAPTAAALGVPDAATGAGSQAAMLAEQNAGLGQAGLDSVKSAAQTAPGFSAQPTPAPSAWDQMQAGYKATKFDSNWLKNNMFPVAAAAAPLLMGAANNSSSSAPSSMTQNPAQIQPYTYKQSWNPAWGQQGQPALMQNYTAGTPYNAAGGGIVGMATGGIAGQAGAGLDLSSGGLDMAQNNSYPAAGLDRTQYAVPTNNMATGSAVIGASYEPKTDPYTGAENGMAAGGSVDPSVKAYNDLLMQRAINEYLNTPPPASMQPHGGQPPMPRQQPAPAPATAPATAPTVVDPSQQQGGLAAFQAPMDSFAQGNGGAAAGGLMGYAAGGQLLRGPGDGVSDSINATIGGHQPARLADGEFVVPARIVSELGNGSTEAGARRLYGLMSDVQNARKKTVGKDSVAVDSKAYKHLPT